MGSEEPDVWPRTVEISFGKNEVSRHDFYDCFEPEGVEASAFDAVVRLYGRTICIFRVGFKSDEGHRAFLAKYMDKESVSINGKEIAIRVRDRTLNLVRVRVHQFKFNDDLGLLSTRLRAYGSVSRIYWDTYQDRQLPKWCGIKTGVVNVDMVIDNNIPSYITFGSYKHPLMVEYPGQMKTCRLCDSQFHVSNTCPTLASKVGPTKPPTNQVTVPHNNVAASLGRPSTSWATVVGGRNVPTPAPTETTEAVQVAQALTSNVGVTGSTPAPVETFSDTEMESEGAANSEATSANKKRKKHSLVSKQLRDQEKQEKRVERRGSQDPPPEKTSARQATEQSSPLLNFDGETSPVTGTIPIPEPIGAAEVAQLVERLSGNTAGEGSTLAECRISLPDDEPDIPAGQRPRDTPLPQSAGNCPLGMNVNSQLTRGGSIEDITIAAMNAYYETKAKSKAAPKKKSN